MNSQSSQLSLDLITREELSTLMKVQGGALHFSNLLMERHQVSPDVLKVRRSEYKKGKSQNYRHHSDLTEQGKGLIWYDTTTLPNPIFEKYNLPSIQEAAKLFSQDFQNLVNRQNFKLDENEKAISVMLESAIDRAFKFEYMFYRNETFNSSSQRLSQKYAVLKSLLDYMKNPQPKIIKTIHAVLQTSKFLHLGFPVKMMTFYPYLQRASKSKDLKSFVLGALNVNNNARKVNEAIEELIRHFAGHSNGVPSKKVMIWVNVVIIAFPSLNGKRKLSIRCVEECISKNATKINIYRKGEEYIRKVVAGYLHMHSAKNPMDQFFMDEWYIEMVCKRSNKSIRKIVLGMMDGRSRKMVNHRQVSILNRDVIKQFIHDTIILCRDRMPAELLCDFASYNVCADISRMLNYLANKYKAKFAWTVSSNANRKAELENFWGTLGSYYLSPLVGSTGRGMTASREKAHPAKVITLFLNDPAFLDDESEADRIIDHMLETYCKKGIHIDLDSPNEIFRDNSAINAISLDSTDLAFMFGTKHERKLNRSEVLVGRAYQFFDESVVNYIGEIVDCYTYDRFPDSVFVFVNDSFELIGEFKNYSTIPKAKVNQTVDDIARLGTMVGMQEAQVESLLKLKQNGLDMLKSQMGNVDPGELAMSLISQTMPEKSTSVKQLNPASHEKIEINAFNLPDKKEAKKAQGDKYKKVPKPVSSTGLLSDNMKDKYAS